ncbi:hypothetical protein Q3G72_001477 [Acer saccharum]|nr:hypothetical protein Q3G72_001477 [Acer saccharum]
MTTNQLTQDLSRILYIVSGTCGQAWSGFSWKALWFSFSLLCQLVWKSTQIADVLKAKGEGADGSWLWCTTDDSVYDAVKSMTRHNVGALVVVKPGEKNSNA